MLCDINNGPEEMLRRFQSAFPQAVQTGYAVRKGRGVIAFNHLKVAWTFACFAVSGIDVRITDPETLEEVAITNVVKSGFAAIACSTANPEKNAEFYNLVRSGDLGSVTETVRSATTDALRMTLGGENVAALEIESHLAKHPSVLLAQVVAGQTTGCRRSR